MMRKVRVIIPACTALSLATGGCAGYFGSPEGGASDVPVLRPTAWSDNVFKLYARREREDSAVLLITSVTFDQADSVRFGENPGPDFHGAVYRFDSETEKLQQLDRTA